jgi:hypothetical protein
MKFYDWLNINESNLNGLYTSTVLAFPKTRKRQYAIDEIKIAYISATPFQGVRTLFIKGLAKNEQNETEYRPMILFKNVIYHNSKNENWAEMIASNGQKFFFEKLNLKKEVVLRCECNDFKWRFNFEDHRDRSLYGRVRKKYEAKINPGSSNPLEMPGMCKHLIKLVNSLHHNGILEE